MNILKFEDFLNEAYKDPINKHQLLIAFVLDRVGKGLKDNFTTATYNVLLDNIQSLRSKIDFKSEIVPTVATAIGISNTELLEFVRLISLDPSRLTNVRKEKLVKDNTQWLKSLSLSDPKLAANYLKGYLKRDDEGKLSNLQHPKYTGSSKSTELTADTLASPFKESLRLIEKDSKVNTKTYSLYNFINDKTNKESKLLEDIKSMKYSKQDTVQMIKVGLNNMTKISLLDYDTIVAPKSSSKILPIFINEIVEYIKDQRKNTEMPPKDLKVINDAFEKIPGKDIEWDYPTIEAITDEKTKNNIYKMIDRISKLTTGVSLSKQVFVGYRKYLKAFMKLTPNSSGASGKILIVDDFITGGTTIKEMRRLMGGNIFALTLFDVVGIDPDAEPDANDPTV